MIKYIVSFVLSFPLYSCPLIAQSTSKILELKTDSLKPDGFLNIGNKVYLKYINEKLEKDEPFKIKVLTTTDSVSIVKSPTSKVHRDEITSSQNPFSEIELDVNLSKDETVEYEISVFQKNGNIFKYQVSLSTDASFNPNCNFIFLSAIRSVAGQPQANEFFDLNLKFNYLGRFFTLFGIDLSLSPADSGQLRINEGLVSVNIFVHRQKRLSSGELTRGFFGGIGSKIFNQQPYVGAHVGSIEINGPLFSSYVLVGYYFNGYGRYSIEPQEEEIVNFRNNIYAESTLAFDNKKDVAGILSDIRIKLGMMFPFTNSKSDIVKPLTKDIQYRLVLEVPIGGIYKFGK